ncbi:hypothetical protein ACX0G9_10490 [Flavitalea flava]
MVKKYMTLVETIYEKGNTMIMQSYMPYGLYTVYLQQVLRSGD